MTEPHSSLTPYEDLGPTRRSISSTLAKPASQPSGKTQVLIGELGLRFRPANSVDLQAHAALLALLARDLADADPNELEAAIGNWVKHSKFMPKASELTEIMDADRLRRQRLNEKPPEFPVRPHFRALPTDRRLTDAEIEHLRMGPDDQRALFLAGKASGRFVIEGNRFVDTLAMSIAA